MLVSCARILFRYDEKERGKEKGRQRAREEGRERVSDGKVDVLGLFMPRVGTRRAAIDLDLAKQKREEEKKAGQCFVDYSETARTMKRPDFAVSSNGHVLSNVHDDSRHKMGGEEFKRVSTNVKYPLNKGEVGHERPVTGAQSQILAS